MKTFDEALAYLVQQASPTTKTLKLPISEARGYVLAAPITSDVNVPPYDNSMMDGYAVCLSDLSTSDEFEVSQRIPAGHTGSELKPGTIARIFTGAPIPPGVDAVIMQEETEQLAEDRVRITAESTRQGQNIRRLGEDIAQGQVILKQGHRLTPQDLGLIASIGVAEIDVYQPLKIATFTTGDELLEPGEAPQAGKIFNSNRYILAGAIPQLGFELIDLGRVEDTLEATIDAMKRAAELADVVMTTGGVSVGEEDHIKPAIDTLGELDMWKVKMKPGKPIAYGRIGDTPFIGLPGNPVSAFATFNLFARPYLQTLQGMRTSHIDPIWVEAAFDWPKANFRREFARAKLVNDTDKRVTRVDVYPKQGSNVLTSTSWADGFVVIPEDTTVTKGDIVAFYSFNDMK